MISVQPTEKVAIKAIETGISFRGVSGYLKLGGQVVMWRAAATAPPPGGAFYSAKNWVGNCPPCPPATYALAVD